MLHASSHCLAFNEIDLGGFKDIKEYFTKDREDLLQVVEVVKERLNSKLKITGIMGTMHEGRQRLDKEIAEMVKERFGDKLFNTLIRRNLSLAEAPSYGQDIYLLISLTAQGRRTMQP